MEKFKKTLKIRMLLTGLYCLLIVALVALGLFRPGDAHVNDYIAGMSLGLCTGIASVAIFNVIRMALALRNEEKLKKLYVSETDERLSMIRTKAGGTGIVFSIGGLLLGAMVAGYFDAAVFFTLVGAAMFVTLVVGCLKGYYFVKYSK
jgi:predicted membrane protein